MTRLVPCSLSDLILFFFGTIYSQFNICSNGFISFNASNSAIYTGHLPSNSPNTLIAGAWEDLNPTVGGTINYYTTGNAPYRRLVVNFINIQHYPTGNPVTMQFILYETYNYIDIHTTSMPGPTATEGIEDLSGTNYLAVPGRNNSSWTATNDAWRFSPGNTVYTYSWSPGTGLSDSTIVNPVASPLVSTEYTVTATDSNGCTGTATISLLVTTPAITITASPDTLCAGGTSQLTATAITTSTNAYLVDSIAYSPVTGTGTSVSLTDDEVSNMLPIGFIFGFYGNYYTQFNISSNGFITFDTSASTNNYSGCCAGQMFPNTAKPNAVIAGAWEDYNPAAGGSIQYFTTGTFPYRKLIVNFKNVPHAPARDSVTFQIILYETTNYIEIHTTAMPGNPNGYWFGHTEGIEDATGSHAVVVPGRNSSNTWTAFNDARRFTPLSPFTYLWTPFSSLSDSSVYNPVATPASTTTYTLNATDANGCIGTATITLVVHPLPAAPVITHVGNQLHSSYSSGNQWYLDSVIINGATSQYYTPTQNGDYTVTYTDSNGCTVTSTPFHLTTIGINELLMVYDFKVYPNPVGDKLFITSEYSEPFEIILFDIASRKLLDEHFTNSVTLKTSQLAKGIYLYELRNKNGSIVNGKVVKE